MLLAIGIVTALGGLATIVLRSAIWENIRRRRPSDPAIDERFAARILGTGIAATVVGVAFVWTAVADAAA